MDFPREKMEIVGSHSGRDSEKGWLILHLGTLDLEGVSRIYVNLDDVEQVRQRGERHSEALEKVRNLLGCDD